MTLYPERSYRGFPSSLGRRAEFGTRADAESAGDRRGRHRRGHPRANPEGGGGRCPHRRDAWRATVTATSDGYQALVDFVGEYSMVRAWRNGAKSDPLDVTCAARKALSRAKLGTPRSTGQRQALGAASGPPLRRASRHRRSTAAVQPGARRPEHLRERFRGKSCRRCPASRRSCSSASKPSRRPLPAPTGSSASAPAPNNSGTKDRETPDSFSPPRA